MIVTVKDLIAELLTVDQMLKVFVFDGAEPFPIEVLRVTHASELQPLIYISKDYNREDTHATIIRQLRAAEHNIAQLSAKIDKARRRLKSAFEFRDTMKRVLETADKRRGQ